MENVDRLKEQIVTSVIWKGLERVGVQLVSSIVSLILARILVPDDYSVVSLVTIFFSFCNIFISGGLNSALIQKKNADSLDYSTILVANYICAIVLYIGVFTLSPFASEAFSKPEITLIMRVMGLTFFVNAYKAVLSAMVSATMQFRLFFYSTLVGTIVSAIVGIHMAINGFGAWALVVQQMVNSFFDTCILRLTTGFKIKFQFSFNRFRVLFAYGGKVVLASLIANIYDQCRPLMVGIKFTITDLAYYNKGMALPSVLDTLGNSTMSSTLFPAMAKVQDDNTALLKIARRFIKLSSFVVLPMMIGTICIADNLVSVFLTAKWAPMVPFLIVYSISYTFDFIIIGNTQVIKSMGRSDLILKIEIIKKSCYAIIIVLAILLADTPFVLAVSSILTSIIAVVVNMYPVKRLIGYSFCNLFQDILPNLIPAIIMGVIVILMNEINFNNVVLLIMQIIVGMLSYIFLSVAMKNENLFYTKNIIKDLFLKNESY